MSVRVIYDFEAEIAGLYCSTTGTLFGKLFHDTGEPHHVSARTMAEEFLSWHGKRPDVRQLTESELSAKQAEFVAKVEAEGAFWDQEEIDSQEW